MTQPPGAGRAAPARSPRRRWAFAAFALVLLAAALELAGAVAFWLGTGSAFTWSRAAALRSAARAGNLAARVEAEADPGAEQAQAAVTAGVVVHPFLGFVYDASKPRGGIPLSPFGFVDEAPPLHKRAADRFLVGLVGGSVALQLGVYAKDELVAALARCPALAGKRIELVRLGLGGYKQPQQLLTVELLLALGGEFDCIINLDGYNEIALVEENLPHGVPAWYPRSWARLLDRQPSPDQQLRLGHLVVLRDERSARIATADALWWSPLGQFVWWWRDRSLARQIGTLQAEVERAAATPSFALTGPGTGGRSGDAARQDMIEVWARASRQLHAVCQAHGIRYCHFLQPNQYVAGSKPIGGEEARVALSLDDPRNIAVAATYPALQAAGAKLAAAGVPFVDLTGIFRDHPEPLYVDFCCHLGGRGNRILAEHVAAGVRRQIELAGADVRALVVDPPTMIFHSPLAGQRLAVFALDEHGQRHDVSGVGFGLAYRASPAGQLVVGPDGRVRPVRPGAGTLRVELGAVAAEVPFTAQWPARFVGDDGRPGPLGSTPRLELDPVPVAGAVRVRCVGMSAAPFRLVVVGRRPLPESPVGADTDDLRVATVVAVGDTADVVAEVPPGAAEPIFVRLYELAANATDVVAASPTLVITDG